MSILPVQNRDFLKLIDGMDFCACSKMSIEILRSEHNNFVSLENEEKKTQNNKMTRIVRL